MSFLDRLKETHSRFDLLRLIYLERYECKRLAIEPGGVQCELSPKLHLFGCVFQFLRHVSEEEKRSRDSDREQAREVACCGRLEMKS